MVIYDWAGTILEPRAQAASASGQARTSTTAPPARHCGSRLGGRSSEAGRGGLRLLLVAQPEAQCHSLASNSKLRSVMVPGASPRCTRALTHRNRILGGVRGVILPADSGGLPLAALRHHLQSRIPAGRIRRLQARTGRRNLVASMPTPAKLAATSRARLPRRKWPGDPRNPDSECRWVDAAQP